MVSSFVSQVIATDLLHKWPAETWPHDSRRHRAAGNVPWVKIFLVRSRKQDVLGGKKIVKMSPWDLKLFGSILSMHWWIWTHHTPYGRQTHGNLNAKANGSFIGLAGIAESQNFSGAQPTFNKFCHKKNSFCDYWVFFICCWQHYGLYAQKVLSKSGKWRILQLNTKLIFFHGDWMFFSLG